MRDKRQRHIPISDGMEMANYLKEFTLFFHSDNTIICEQLLRTKTLAKLKMTTEALKRVIQEAQLLWPSWRDECKVVSSPNSLLHKNISMLTIENFPKTRKVEKEDEALIHRGGKYPHFISHFNVEGLGRSSRHLQLSLYICVCLWNGGEVLHGFSVYTCPKEEMIEFSEPYYPFMRSGGEKCPSLCQV